MAQNFTDLNFKPLTVLLNVTTKKRANNPIGSWAKYMRHLSKNDVQMENKHVKKMINIITFREMQISTITYHYQPSRTVKIKNSDNNKCWKVFG